MKRLILATIFLAGCDHANPSGVPEVTSARLDPRLAIVRVADSISFTYSPPNASVRRLEVDDSTVVQIVGPLTLVGLQPGKVKVFLQSAGATDTASVTVIDKACTLEAEISPETATIGIGEHVELNVYFCGSKSTDFTFSTSSANVTVTPAGEVTGVKAGDAVITATSNSDDTITAIAIVHVK